MGKKGVGFQTRSGEDGSPRQFAVVAVGGHWAFREMGDDSSGTLVAFALSKKR